MYLPIAMLVVKYKSPIGRTQEENNPMKIQKCGTGAKETALQIGRASTVRRASAQQSYQKVEENVESD